ncbi:MAG: zinc protease, partial [Limisphaerales bacterium]
NIPNFDSELQKAGGTNNAYTSNDVTNYYDIVPAQNLETALWLEADRMNLLDFSERSLEVQRKVVCEEFKENYINQPYGDVWHKLRSLVYKSHPYRWPTIGLKLEHVEEAELQDVRDFFYKHYRPNNAILTVAGGVKTDEVLALTEKWFGSIEPSEPRKRALPIEAEIYAPRELTVEAKVPVDVMYKAWHMCERSHPDYYATDLLSDVLSGGSSSRLYRILVKDKQLFSEVEAYVSGSHDKGMFVVEGKYADGVDRKVANEALDAELDRIRTTNIEDSELEKVRNQTLAYEAFGNIAVLNKAMKLSMYELLGGAEQINTESDAYHKVSAEDIKRVTQEILDPQKVCTLNYLAKKEV